MSDYKKDYLGYNFIWFMGVVEDRLDPLKLGRVRVRCFSWHTEDKIKVPTEALPWAQCVFDPTNASLNGIGRSPTGILEGSWVFGFFLDVEDAQKPLVLGTMPGIPQNSSDPSKGFNDPNGRYPNILNEPDTSRLARNEYIINTIVKNKIDTTERNIPIANSNSSWSQPYNPYNAKYPFNKVWETESGHVIELDDSPNSERIHIYHRKGTFIEIDRNGTKVSKVTGNNFTILERDDHLYVKGNLNVTIEGDANLYVKNNLNMDVDGDFNLKVKNDFTLDVSGNTHFSTKEEFNLLSNTVSIESHNGNIELYANGSLNTLATNEINVKSTNDTNFDSDNLYLNSDKAKSANKSGLLRPEDRVVVSPVTLEPFLTYNRNEEYALELDDEVAEGGIIPQKFIDNFVQFVGTTAEQIATIPEVPSSASGKVDNTPTVPAQPVSTIKDSIILNKTAFPDTYKLSENFILADLSTKAAFPHRVRAQVGLTEGEIIQNLKGVAENVLEPIFAKFPNFTITSGFRPGSGRSQHYRGQAIDIQFPIRKSQYYERAIEIKNLISFDQFLLEYKNTSTGNPWLHISWSYDSLRGQNLTFFNHRKHSSGFTNLA